MIKTILSSLFTLSCVSACGANVEKHFDINIRDIWVHSIKGFSISPSRGPVICSPSSGNFNNETYDTGIISCVDTHYSPNDAVTVNFDGYCSKIKLAALHENGTNACYVVSSARYFGRVLISCDGNSYEPC